MTKVSSIGFTGTLRTGAASVAKRAMPQPLKDGLLDLRAFAERTCRRFANSAKAFRTGQGVYRLEIASVGTFTVAYRSNTADDLVLAQSFDDDKFFAWVPEYAPGAADTILDVGAHIGLFSLLAASKVTVGKVFAVEPCRETFNYLRLNVALNRCANIEIDRIALGGESGESLLYHSDENWGHSTVAKLSGHAERVAAETLSDYMRRKGMASVDFVKFNCEGAEFPILLNTPADVLGRFKRMLVLYHLDLAKGARLQVLLDHLAESGFKCEIRNRTGRRGWIVAFRNP
jgi:FkbM family methyltransferase